MNKFFLIESKFNYDQCEHEFVTSDLFSRREAARKHLAEIVAADKETGVCARYLDSDRTGEDDFRVITDTPDLFEAYGDGSNSVEVRVVEKSVVPNAEEYPHETTTMNELKLPPCPFCGGRAVVIVNTKAEDDESDYVRCRQCGGRTAQGHGEDIIKDWNNRVLSLPAPQWTAEPPRLSRQSLCVSAFGKP